MKVPGEKGQVANTLLTDATLVHADWYKPIPSPSAPYQPKWERWLYVPRIELGKAIALTLDIDPACLSSGKHLIPDDFKTRLAVAIEHLQPGGVLSDFAGEARHDSIVVTLQEVARLAQLCRWTLPPEFPRHIEQGAEAPPPNCAPPKDAGKRVTNAPPPITPIRGGITRLPRPAAVAPKWQEWRMEDFVAPWEAAALSLGLEPRSIAQREKRDFRDDATCEDFWMRERIIKNADWAAVGRSMRGIRLPDFAAWAIRKGMEIPDELRALAEGATPPATQPLDAAPEPQLFSADADQGEQEDRAQESSTGTWHDRVREVADELHRKDINAGAWSSNKDIAERVASEAIKRGIRGPTGQLTAGNILREALQGGRWKRPAN